MAVETHHIKVQGGGKGLRGTEWELTFSDGNHQYRVKEIKDGVAQSGKSVVSVTGITGMLDKPGLVHWASRITADYILKHLVNKKGGFKAGAEDRLDGIFEKAKQEHKAELNRAANIGTICHDGVEQYLKSGKKLRKSKNRPEQAVNAFNNFVDWWKNDIKGGRVYETERKVYNPELHYSGTLDICAEIHPEGKPLIYIIDVKTTNGFHSPEMPMQLAAYAEAYEIIEDIKIDGIGIIRLDKETGQSHWKDYTPYRNQAWSMFKHLVKVKELMKVMK